MNKYPFISYIKALCIMAVIICHYKFTSDQRLNIFFPYLIDTAVPFFMFITAFNYSNSYFNNNISNLYQMYNWKVLLRRIQRIAIPFTLVALIQWFFIVPYRHYTHSFTTFYINGGLGPGSFYFPVMIQLLALFPLIYLIINKWKLKGVFLIFIANLLFEFICAATNISGSAYRLMFFRYLMFIALGVYGFLYKDEIKNSVLTNSLIVGIVYLALAKYCDTNITYPFMKWKDTSMLVAFYVFPLFMWAYRYFSTRELSNLWLGKFLTVTGNATWHIFLVQMTFFLILKKRVLIPLQNETLSIVSNISLDLFICLTIGIVFYFIESRIYKLFTPKEKKS